VAFVALGRGEPARLVYGYDRWAFTTTLHTPLLFRSLFFVSCLYVPR
jgi:hypothetical protein